MFFQYSLYMDRQYNDIYSYKYLKYKSRYLRLKRGKRGGFVNDFQGIPDEKPAPGQPRLKPVQDWDEWQTPQPLHAAQPPQLAPRPPQAPRPVQVDQSPKPQDKRLAALRRARGPEAGAIKSPIGNMYTVNWDKPIGKGSFGKVYEAMMMDREGAKSKVVLKSISTIEEAMEKYDKMQEMLKNQNMSKEQIEAIRKYGMMLQKMKDDAIKEYDMMQKMLVGGECSKYVVCPIEYFERQGKFLIVTEHLKSFPPIIQDLEHLKDLARYLLKGLVELHKIGIHHRDIKEENIMMRGNSPVYIDLGLSCFDCKESGVGGSPLYMAPEYDSYDKKQVSSKQAEQCNFSSESMNKIDVYALGLTLKFLRDDFLKGRTDIVSGTLNCLIKVMTTNNPSYRFTAQQALDYFDKKMRSAIPIPCQVDLVMVNEVSPCK